jgi:stage II sporulation protein D
LKIHIPLLNNGRLRSDTRHTRSVRLASLAVITTMVVVVLTAVFALPVSAATGDFIIQGRGTGHGAGMSQWGAWEAAREGQPYTNILGYYYPTSGPAVAPPGATIKVRISRDPASNTYQDHYYRVYLKPVVTTATLRLKNDGSGDVLVPLAVGQVVETFYASVSGEGHVWVSGLGAYDDVYVEPSLGTGRVAVSMQVSSVATATTYREYWGDMRVEPMAEGELYLNNWILLDKYVRGVAEIKPEWANSTYTNLYAIEAVKAQAVAARTYAWAEYNNIGYVNDDSRDIYYKGYAFEVANPGAAQAATDTAGEIRIYGLTVNKTYFSASSGGYTTASAWNDSPPSYVVSQADPWSRAAPPAGLVTGVAPGDSWTVTFTPTDLSTKLITGGYIDNVGTVTSVEVIGRDVPADPESHVTAVRITGTLGTDTISGRNFKAALGLRSTLFGVVLAGSPVRMDGKNANIARLGYWNTSDVAAAFGGSFFFATSWAKASVSFDGTYLALIGKTGPNYGKAWVTLDSGPAVPVDLYTPSALYQRTVYSAASLTSGVHKVTIEWSGNNNFLSTGTAVSFDAVDVVGTLNPSPDIPPRYEEDDSNFAYGGPWSVSSSPAATDGTMKTLNGLGSVTVTFTGTYLAWVAKTAPYCGKARVTLDAGTPDMVDLYSATEAYAQTVWNTGDLGPIPAAHTVTIEWTGTKNGAASNYQIGADAFDVIGSVTLAPPAPVYPTRYQQSEAYITYLGTWAGSAVASASGGSIISSSVTNSQATICFHGTGLSLLAKTGPDCGIAQVTLNGVPALPTDFYSAGTLYQQVVYNTGPPLPEDDYTVVITPTGTKNLASSGYAINLDALDIFGNLTAAPVPTRYQQTESNLTYVGPWVVLPQSAASGGSIICLNGNGSVTVSFTGTYLAWVTKKSNQYGKAWVRLDDGVPQLVDLYSASALNRQTVWKTGVLTSGTHVLCISWSGIKNSSSQNTNIGADAFDVMGTLNAAPAPPDMPTRYQQNNSKIVYTGAWHTFSYALSSGGSRSYLNGPGTVTVKFNGTYFSWVTRRSPVYGIADVTVDGVPVVPSVDLYRSAALEQANAYETGILPPAVHTVVITWTNTKNASATDTNIGADAFDIIGTLTL